MLKVRQIVSASLLRNRRTGTCEVSFEMEHIVTCVSKTKSNKKSGKHERFLKGAAITVGNGVTSGPENTSVGGFM